MGTITAWIIGVVLVFSYCTSTKGARMCFRSRTTENKCKDLLTSPNASLPHNDKDCCSSKDAMYYVDAANGNSFITIMIVAFGGLENCTPCRPSPTKTAPCSRVCPTGQTCVSRHGREKCVCNRNCQSGHNRSKVCGTDNKTYKHECDLLKKACSRGTGITVAYDGSCQIGCSNVVCRRQNHTCITDQYFNAHCVSCATLPPCSNTSKNDGPLCGADGRQYASSCALRSETCRQGKAIGIAYHGQCIANATCNDIDCGNKLCLMDNAGRPRCIICNCSEKNFKNGYVDQPNQKNKEVCGTDMKTYMDYCSLREAVCKTKAFIEIKYPGSCRGDPAGTSGSLRQPADERFFFRSRSRLCDQIHSHYIMLNDFMSLLSQNLGLNVTLANNRQLVANDKYIFIDSLIRMLKRKWKKN